MSYCVQCGVKLEKTAKNCPLCSTPVINPNSKYEDVKKSQKPAYANQVLALDYDDRKYTAIIINLVLIALNIITFVINILFISEITFWPIVVGSTVLLSVVISLPLLFREISPYIYLIALFLAVFITFASISITIKTWNWVFYLALPILSTVFVLAFIWIFIKRKFNKGIMFNTAQLALMIGVLCVMIEGFIKQNTKGNFFSLSWSLIVLTCGVTIALILLIISKNKRWRAEVRKRFHF